MQLVIGRERLEFCRQSWVLSPQGLWEAVHLPSQRLGHKGRERTARSPAHTARDDTDAPFSGLCLWVALTLSVLILSLTYPHRPSQNVHTDQRHKV